jgi:hypothetical protein
MQLGVSAPCHLELLVYQAIVTVNIPLFLVGKSAASGECRSLDLPFLMLTFFSTELWDGFVAILTMESAVM